MRRSTRAARRGILAVGAVAMSVVALAACGGGGGDDDSTEPTTTTSGEPAPGDTTTTTEEPGAIDVETIELSHPPSGVAAVDDTLYYVSSEDDVLVKVDLATGEETDEVEVGDYPLAVAVTDDAAWVTLGSFGASAIVRVDPETMKVVTTIDATPGDGPTGVAATPEAVWVQVGGTGKTARIDPAENAITTTIDPRPKFNDGGGAWISATTDATWVVDRNQGRVLRIDPKTNKIVATIDDLGYRSEDAGDGLTSILSQGPIGVTATDDAVWVVAEVEGEGSTTTGEGVTVTGAVFQIDPETNEVLEQFDLEETPASGSSVPKPGLAVDGDDGWVIDGDRAYHMDLTDGTTIDLLSEAAPIATFNAVAVGPERIWFAAETAGSVGNALFGVDPESLG